MEPLQLTDSQNFEIEKFSRIIDSTTDATALKAISNQLLRAYMSQKAATVWAMGPVMSVKPACHD
jgi:hypothetical protein